MIHYKSKNQLACMREAGFRLAEVFQKLSEFIQVGMTAEQIDAFVYKCITSLNAKPSFLGYSGYKYSCCISKNEEVVHGIPHSHKLMLEGDICSIDIGVYYKGYHADAARTFLFEPITKEANTLCKVTEESFYKALEFVRPGARLGDLGNALQNHVESNGFSVVKDLYSHGIGQTLHEDPLIPNFGNKGKGLVLRPGFTFAFEPMVNVGTHKVLTLDDNWTIITQDKMLSAHYENTVAVTESGYEILTLPR